MARYSNEPEQLDDCGHCTLLPTATGWGRAVQVACPVHGDPRPVETREDRMRHATTTDRSFAAYLTRVERDQLDARAATAEAERDEYRDERDNERRRAEKAERERDSLARRLSLRFEELEELRAERDRAREIARQGYTEVGRLRAELADAVDLDPAPRRRWWHRYTRRA